MSIIAAGAVLAGCTPQQPFGEVADVDRQRYDVLRADPVFAGLGVEIIGRPGETRDFLLARGEVSADIGGLADPAELRARGRHALDEADRSGWTVYRTECTGGAAAGAPLLWTAWAYKITGGVSYLLRIASVTSSSTYPVTGEGAVQVDAYAPHSAEPAPDLIPEHPPAVAASCIRAAAAPASTTVQGLDVVFRGTVNRDSPPSRDAPTR